MAGYEQIMLVGNLGGDPELRYTPQGHPVANFSLATNRVWTGADGEKREQVVWWRVTCWRGLAESVSQYLAKGREVLVVGRMNPDENGNPRTWEGKDGVTRASYEITAQTVKFLGSRANGQGTQSVPPDEAEEIPF